MKDRIEEKINEKIIIQENRRKNWSKVYFEKKEGKMSDELIEWAAEKIKIFIETVQPEVDNFN